MTKPTWDLLIVGGGPTGLVAGLEAAARGLRFRILERDAEPRARSRSIGIHPPALQLLAELGVTDALVEAGSQIRRGEALAGPGQPLGTLDFGSLPPPWNFILTLPQWKTEAILEAELLRRAPGSLVRSRAVQAVEAVGEGLQGRAVVLDQPVADLECWTCRYLLACDGKRSELRSAAGIAWKGAPYPQRFVMGDFPTDPEGRSDALIVLHPRGLVESFPLGPTLRRWVVERGDDDNPNPAAALVREVFLRVGTPLDPASVQDLSTFGVERFQAARFCQGRMVLAGDAAHVVSPIGGQGMNLAWLNVRDAVRTLHQACVGDGDWDTLAPRLETRMRKRAQTVAARAEQNLWLATRGPLRGLRNRGVQGLLHSPFRKELARRFSMHNV
jgi:2-polyprenyl-6-methoxyphenol hydroxylase-like FAD-dependent oxidoreductase